MEVKDDGFQETYLEVEKNVFSVAPLAMGQELKVTKVYDRKEHR